MCTDVKWKTVVPLHMAPLSYILPSFKPSVRGSRYKRRNDCQLGSGFLQVHHPLPTPQIKNWSGIKDTYL